MSFPTYRLLLQGHDAETWQLAKDASVQLQSFSMNVTKVTQVIVCQLPDSYAEMALGVTEKVDMAKARAQHTAYVETLRNIVPNIKVLPADEKFPDCVFVEDAAVIVGGHALLTQPGDPSRRGEIVRMRRVLRDEVGLVVMEVNDPDAKLDGGDVLWTGREILVGLSSRTNDKGVQAVQEAFPGYPVTGIEVAGPLHLKTLLTLCGQDTLCASLESGDSYKMLERIDEKAKFAYKRVLVPDDMSANLLCINGHIVCKSASEAPKSYEILQQQMGTKYKIIGLELSEIEKAVGSLTCMSLRFEKPSMVKPVGTRQLVCRYEDVE